MGEHGAVNITGIRETGSRFDGGHHVAQFNHGGYLITALYLAEILH